MGGADWSHSPASAAPAVVMRTAMTTPTEGTPFRSTHTPMASVKSGRQRLKTTYMGRLRPRRDHRVRVDCRVERTHTGANSCRQRGGERTLSEMERGGEGERESSREGEGREGGDESDERRGGPEAGKKRRQ